MTYRILTKMATIRSPTKKVRDDTDLNRMTESRAPAQKTAFPKVSTQLTTESAKTKTRLSTGECQPGKPEERPPPASRLSSPTESFSNSKLSNRLDRANELVREAKQHLNQARNLKTEIKNDAFKVIDKLFGLIKEGELELSKRDQAKETEKSKEEDLAKIIEQHAKLIKENNQKMEQLKETLEQNEPRTYASVVGVQTQRKPSPGALHSVVVTSRDETETGDEILERIRKVVDAKEGGVKIDRIRKARDRKVIVGCKTEDDRRRVKEKLIQVQEHLHTEDVKNKKPLVLLRDVLKINSAEDIKRALKNQNSNIFEGLKEEEKMVEIVYNKPARNPHTQHTVIRVAPKVWQRMTETGAVHIDLQRIRVNDQSPLVQCSMCLGYGHGRRFCTETVEKCSHCGGPHKRAQCELFMAGAPPSCCNCVRAKYENTEHSAFGDSCPIRQKWDALARSAIAYC